MRGRMVLLLAAFVVSLILLPLPAAEAAGGGGLIPACTDISFEGRSGQINIRTSPNRYVAWNIAMHSPLLNDGPWTVTVYVNNRVEDRKTQTYQPHGSIHPTHLPEGSFVSIEAFHTDFTGSEHVFVPNQCIVP